MNCRHKLNFLFTDFTSYKANEYTLLKDGEYMTLSEKSNEFCALKKACENLNITDLLVNMDENKTNTKGKFRLIEFNDLFNKGSLLETKGLVGVVQINNVTIEVDELAKDENEKNSETFDVKITITSRFDNPTKPYFLMNMLSFETPDFFDNADIESEDESLFAILLIHIFKKQLLDANNQGIFKTYKFFERNDDKVKGVIDIARHIQYNGMFSGRIAYRCRDYTADNLVNQLILHAYYRLKRRFRDESRRLLDEDAEIRSIIKRLIELNPSFGSNNVQAILKSNIQSISHPFYLKYKSLQVTCLKILRNLGVNVFDGTNDNVKGLLYYIPDLWESYLLHNYKKYITENTFVVQPQEEIKICQSVEYYGIKVIPDFVFRCSKGNIPFFVLDAKFKPNWYDVATLKASLKTAYVYDDYLQVINYMVSFNTKSAGVIFPTNQESWRAIDVDRSKLNIRAFSVSKYNDNNKFYCFAIYIPEPKNTYAEWSKLFEASVICTFKDLSVFLSNQVKT